MKLNVWNRLGVVVSVLWVIGVSGYAGYEFIQAREPTRYFDGSLNPQNIHELHFVEFTDAPSSKDAWSVREMLVKLKSNMFADVLVEARIKVKTLMISIFAPIAALWIIAYSGYVAICWVWRGTSIG